MELVRAILGDAPVDPSVLAKTREPAFLENRAQIEAHLRAEDWPNLGRYQESNAAIIGSGVRPDVVFMGDSISEAWPLADPNFFSASRVGRGIGGQTSPQMLVRFYPDVLALRPKAVHIVCGSNDIATNTGPTTPYRYQCNLLAMIELARSQELRVILGLLPPAAFIPWTGFESRAWVIELNAWLRTVAASRSCTLVDYHAPLDDGSGGMRTEFTHDGVHPNRRGYAVMREALEPLL
jgi:lysophospholipase L1-like esterase